jgi:predicted pyridoxine 5'-phosphate oxidase superfamily flavin-nucleotide-binding protein
MLRFRGFERRAVTVRRPPHPTIGGQHLPRITDATRGGGLAIAWLFAAALIALGAAGVVAGMDTPAADGADRSGRTGHGDALANASLDVVEADMRALSASVAALGDQARVILASLSSNETDAVDAATATGTQLVADIDAQTEPIRDALEVVPVVGSRAAAYELSPETIARHASYVDGLKSTEAIESAWTRLTVGALSANRLSALLAAHDQAVVDAAAAGRKGQYPTALKHLDDADAAIADAKTLRDRLKATVDVATLDEWLDRSGDYDVALRALYDTVRRGASNTQIREAVRKEQAAKDRLPPDTRSLVLIMADIGQGGINEAAIDIEQAKADLDEALAPPVDEAAP